MRFIDLFCGIGGFRLGLEKANTKDSSDNESRTSQYGRCSFHCVWSNDNDRYACQIYRKHFGEVCEQDIRTVDPFAIPEHDLLCAGFPCQSFSIAGKRRGFEDTRGTLFFEICRVIQAKRPGYLFLENVKGLLSHDDGATFQTIIGTLDELGYDCQWQVLNSKDYGVPQNRERVFIIGHLRGQPRPKVFPIGEDNQGIAERADETTDIRCLQGGGHSGGHHSGMTLIHTAYPDLREYEDVSPTISTPSGGGHLPYVKTVYQGEKYPRKPKDGKKQGGDSSSITSRVYSPEGLSAGLMTQERVIPQIEVAQALQTDGQLRQGVSWGTDKPQSSRNIRRLTPLECERLQGFPDGWTEGISDTQRYKCLGNAVTVNAIEAIGCQMLLNLSLTPSHSPSVRNPTTQTLP